MTDPRGVDQVEQIAGHGAGGVGSSPARPTLRRRIALHKRVRRLDRDIARIDGRLEVRMILPAPEVRRLEARRIELDDRRRAARLALKGVTP